MNGGYAMKQFWTAVLALLLADLAAELFLQ